MNFTANATTHKPSKISYAWDFGDGSTDVSTGVSNEDSGIKHSYKANGNYTVFCKATSGTESVTKSFVVAAEQNPPVFQALKASGTDNTVIVSDEGLVGGISVHTYVGATVNFSADASATNGGSLTYTWDFGDGTTGTGASVSHVYTKPLNNTSVYNAVNGIPLVICTVNDGTVNVVYPESIIVICTPTYVSPTQPLDLFVDIGANVIKIGTTEFFTVTPIDDKYLSANLTYTWDFGDGTTGTGASTSHSYEKDGDYQVSCTAITSGKTLVGKTEVVVDSNALGITSVATATPSSVIVGDTVNFFTAASSGNGFSLTYMWDFSDGTTGNGASVSHVYSEVGDFVVMCTITDGVNFEYTDVVVHVAEVPFTVEQASGGVQLRSVQERQSES